MAKVVLKIPPTGDPSTPAPDNNMFIAPKTKYENDLDLRDRLSELAIRGNSLKPDDRNAILSHLTSVLGRDKAIKVMDHAFIFNSRPEVQRLSPEEKIKSFYTIGSNDPDVMAIISRTKNLGYGVIPGFRESSSALNQAIQNGTDNAPIASVDPNVTKRIMLRVGK